MVDAPDVLEKLNTIVADLSGDRELPRQPDEYPIQLTLGDIRHLQRQIAEMRAERDALRESKEYAQRCCESAEAERDRLAAENERLREIMGRVPTALNSHFSAGMEGREGGSARRQEKLMKYGEDLLSDIASLEDRA